MKINNLQLTQNGDNLKKPIKIEKKQLSGYASIDKPWLKYYDKEFHEKDIPDMSIYQLALESNKNNMDNIALDVRSSQNDFNEGFKITYGQLFDNIEKSAKASLEMGIKKDEIVPIILPNIPEARILIYSDNMIGSTTYPISPLMPENQLQQIINKYNIRNLFIFAPLYQKYAKSLKKTSLENIVLLNGQESFGNEFQTLDNYSKEILKNDKRIIPWFEYISYSDAMKKKIDPIYEPNHNSVIIGTSGTTGSPKGVCLSDRNINAAALAYKNGNVFPGTMMDALIPSISYGLSMLHYQTLEGKYVYLIPELLTTRFPEALEKIKPDCFPGGPVHYINLKNSDQFKQKKLPQFKVLLSGGASLPKEVESGLNKVDENYSEQNEESKHNENLIVRQGYGLTENVALGSISKIGTYKFGSIGVPMPYLNVGIFNPDTDEELTYGQQGEICMTGPTVMMEYLDNQEETNKVIKIHKDGKRWIHTKDIGYMDKDGNIFHLERTKNIFMRTGFNVHPSKIAEFINTIPFVKNSVVIGFDHPEQQQVPIAFIELDEELTKNMTQEQIENELKEQCYSNLEETSVPYEYVFVNFLPVNLGGKIDQQKIKKESEIDLNQGKIMKKVYFKHN